MDNLRLIGGKPRIGIRPIIDGRRGGTYRAPEAGGRGDFPGRWRGGDLG